MTSLQDINIITIPILHVKKQKVREEPKLFH